MVAKKQPAKVSVPVAATRPSQTSLTKRYFPVFILLAIGFIGGFLWLMGMRYFLVKIPETHYHANFAVYINGQREEFKEFTYYEEVAACTSAYAENPKGRVHMHDKVNNVIHVHDLRVTYGNFFQNIGWSVGDEYIANLTQVFQADANNKVVYILNGDEVESIASRVIGNEDRLLVSFGPNDTDFDAQFGTVANTAAEVNKYQDPASCSGIGGAGHDSLGNRLKRATFWN